MSPKATLPRLTAPFVGKQRSFEDLVNAAAEVTRFLQRDLPFLLLGATLAFLFGDRIRAFAAARSRAVTPQGALGLFAVSLYGGYFNGGLGILLLAVSAMWWREGR